MKRTHLRPAAILCALFALLAPVLAHAQSAVQQVGAVTPSHASVWLANGQVGDETQVPNWLSGELDNNFGSTPGEILCRATTEWQALTPGTNGQYLISAGSACPAWTTTTPGGIPVAFTRAQIPTENIGANQTISVSGYRTANDLGYGAVYTSVNATSTGLGAIQDAGGTWFNLVLNGHANVGWFGAYAGATAITSADVTANPQWRGCYAVGTKWDYVAFQEAVYAALATNSTPAASGCTPPVAPLSLGNISWNALSSLYKLNAEIDVPCGNYQVVNPIVIVGSHFKYNALGKGCAIISWSGTAAGGNPAGTVIWCDACSYSEWHSLSLNNANPQNYQAGQPLLILDWDGTYASLKTQQNTFYDLYCAFNVNGGCVSISPSGGTAQGDTQTFVNPILIGTLSDYGIKINSANALQENVFGGDCQSVIIHGCIWNNGGTFAAYDFHTENQVTNFQGNTYPFNSQATMGGADYLTTGGVSSANCSLISNMRSESDVYSISVPAGCNDIHAGYVVGVDVGSWTANSVLFPRGAMVQGAGAAKIFMAVSTGSLGSFQFDNFQFPTSITANTLTDTNQNWTVNGLAGDRLLFRFGSTGFATTCSVASNTATVITLTTNCLSPPAASTSMYAIQGETGGSTPNWASASAGHNTLNAGNGQGATIAAGDNRLGVGSIASPSIHVGDWFMIPGASNVAPGGTSPTFPAALFAQVTSQSASPCAGSFTGSVTASTTLTVTAVSNQIALGAILSGGGMSGNPTVLAQQSGTPGGIGVYTLSSSQTASGTITETFPGTACETLSASAVYPIANGLAYWATPITDGSVQWINLNLDAIAGANLVDDFTAGAFTQYAPNLGNMRHIHTFRSDWFDANTGLGTPTGPGATNISFRNDAEIGCATPLTWGATVDLTTPSQTCNTLTGTVTSAATLNAPTPVSGQSETLHLQLASSGSSFTVTFGTNFTIPAQFASTWASGTSGKSDFYFQSTGLNGWVEVAGPNMVANAAITGSPASGNLAKFSGATSLTNGDLSGDCTTSGTLAITCTKTGGFPISEIQLGKLTGANFNSTADQAISLSGPAKFAITRIVVTNASTSLTTAQGAIYLAPSKTTPFASMTSTSAYTWLTNSTLAVAWSAGSNGGVGGNTTTCASTCSVYLSLTTGQGATATADVYVYGTALQFLPLFAMTFRRRRKRREAANDNEAARAAA